MGGSYKQCPGCGKRALSIATRCPGCGEEFPLSGEGLAFEPERPPAPGHTVSGTRVGAVVVLAALGIFVASRVSRSAGRFDQRSSLGAAVTSAVPTEVGTANPTFSDGDSAPALPSVLPDSSRRMASAHAAPGDAPIDLPVTRGALHVRKGRSRSAPLEAILVPGDTASADSLVHGWYRVTFEGEVLGYADHAALERSTAISGVLPRSP